MGRSKTRSGHTDGNKNIYKPSTSCPWRQDALEPRLPSHLRNRFPALWDLIENWTFSTRSSFSAELHRLLQGHGVSSFGRLQLWDPHSREVRDQLRSGRVQLRRHEERPGVLLRQFRRQRQTRGRLPVWRAMCGWSAPPVRRVSALQRLPGQWFVSHVAGSDGAVSADRFRVVQRYVLQLYGSDVQTRPRRKLRGDVTGAVRDVYVSYDGPICRGRGNDHWGIWRTADACSG